MRSEGGVTLTRLTIISDAKRLFLRIHKMDGGYMGSEYSVV